MDAETVKHALLAVRLGWRLSSHINGAGRMNPATTFPWMILLCACALPFCAPDASAQTLVSERTERSAGGETRQVREIQLETGEVATLTHVLLQDGDLLLRAVDQSADAMHKLDRYCQTWGASTSRTAEARYSPSTVGLLPCLADKPAAQRRRLGQPDRTATP
jgi:hypothetical protein